MKKHALLFVLCLTIGGCGWQLRGYQEYLAEGDQTIQRLHVRSSIDNRMFQLSLQQLLKDRGIELTPDASLRLMLSDENTERRPLSYSSTGIPVQYQLIMSVSYSVENLATADKPDLQEYNLTTRRQYDFDTALVVAKKEEENKLLAEMRRELSARIIANLQKTKTP